MNNKTESGLFDLKICPSSCKIIATCIVCGSNEVDYEYPQTGETTKTVTSTLDEDDREVIATENLHEICLYECKECKNQDWATI
jgi:hypothetical protein